MASKSEQETAAANGMWLIHPSHKHKKNSGSMLTGRKHTKNRETGRWLLKLGDQYWSVLKIILFLFTAMVSLDL